MMCLRIRHLQHLVSRLTLFGMPQCSTTTDGGRSGCAARGWSIRMQVLPVRRQWSCTRQYWSWLMQPVWQITQSAAAMLVCSGTSLMAGARSSTATSLHGCEPWGAAVVRLATTTQAENKKPRPGANAAQLSLSGIFLDGVVGLGHANLTRIASFGSARGQHEAADVLPHGLELAWDGAGCARA